MMFVRTVVAAFGVALAGATDYEMDDGVVVGTDSNFQSILGGNEFVLAEFYAPWCGHCKALTPEYKKAANTLAAEESLVTLVKVDATVNTELAEKYEVEGYPTIKWFKGGASTEYGGGRTADDIVAWVTKKSGPAAVPVDTVAQANKQKEANGVIAFGFFESEDSAEAEAFRNAAEASEIMFAISYAVAVATEFATAAPKVIVFTDFEEKRYEYEGAFTKEEIATFVTGNSLPLIMEFTDESAAKIFGGQIKSHLLMFSKFSDPNWETNKGTLATVAKKYKGQLLWITLDAEKPANRRVMEFFGITVENTPTVRIINVTQDMQKFAPPSPDLSVDSLTHFVKSYTEGSAGEHLNSEATPADWDAKPVKVLTGGNFAEVALDPTKSVFVEFYAPWCGHCKQLTPIWQKLAAAYEVYNDVVVAQLDSTANEIKDVSIESFPTLKLFPKGDGAEVIDCTAERTYDGLSTWLAEQARVKPPVVGELAADIDDANMGGGDGPPPDDSEKHDEL